MTKENKRIVLGVTGSIAAYKSAEIIRRLQEHPYDVSVVMTEEAQKFITPTTLSTLANDRVYDTMFGEEWSSLKVPHINLAKQADMVLIAPATANMIAKLACGMADDLLSCLVLATKAPVVVAPAMNEAMYTHPIVQENCCKLEKAGYHMLSAEEGALACGTKGPGRLVAVERIVKKVLELI
jgi:phosphopantothenoylcysteine decarboxylase/phosphopantothenate--cysteine ligase